MTCDDCQAIIIDIARGLDVDRATRDEVRRHAALCAACGEQPQEQQWLSTQLRAIRAAESTHNAPARVEIAVLAAWRAAQTGPALTVSATPAVATSPSSVVAMRPRKSWVIPSVALAGLAAAAMAMVFVWPAISTSGRGGSKAPAPSVSALHSANNPDTAGTRATLDRNKQDRGDGVPASAATAVDDDDAAAAPPARMRPPRAHVDAVMADATMRATQFLPLPYVEPLRATEARHVVRVSMTSGDEMILGMLPADRRSGQPFEADVLVGEDGIARAIRIVQ